MALHILSTAIKNTWLYINLFREQHDKVVVICSKPPINVPSHQSTLSVIAANDMMPFDSFGNVSPR